MQLFWILVIVATIGMLKYIMQTVISSRAVRDKMDVQLKILQHQTVEADMTARRSDFEGGAHSVSPSFFAAPVSVLVPLGGLEDNLFDNLESLCLQEYPEYEIVFALRDLNDPAGKVAGKIREKYPERRIVIAVEPRNLDPDSKIGCLICALAAARYPYVFVADGKTLIDRRFLGDMMQYMRDPETASVVNLVRGAGSRTMGSVLENLHLNLTTVGSVFAGVRYGFLPPVPVKTLLARKSDLEEIGGIRALRESLGEDFSLEGIMRALGGKTIVSGRRITTVNRYWTLKKFLKSHIRSGERLWKCSSPRYIMEILENAVFVSLLSILLCGIDQTTFAFFTGVCAVKIASDSRMGSRIGAPHKKSHYLLSPVKDILLGLIWIAPVIQSPLAWITPRPVLRSDPAFSPLMPLKSKPVANSMKP